MVSTLSVLMWKHLVVRKRRFIATPIEFILPCLFFILMYVLWVVYLSPNETEKKFNLEENVHHTDVLPLKQTPAPGLVLFTPNTPWTQDLMEEVGKKIYLRRLNHFPDRRSRGYYAVTHNDSASKVQKLVESMRDTSAYVIFRGMEGEAWPEKLNYTIRMKVDFMTHVIESLDSNNGPHMKFGTIYEPFLHLQWAIDSSYIKLVSGNEVKKAIYLQEFPYLDKKQNQMGAVFGNITPLMCELSLMMTFIFLVIRLMEHRTSGVQELIRMVGVSNKMIAFSEFLNVLPIGVLFATVGAILLTVSSNPIFIETNPFLLWLAFFFHFFTVVTLAFVTSHLLNSMQYATVLAVLLYMILRFPNVLVANISNPFILLICLRQFLLNGPLYMFFTSVAKQELDYKGVTFSNMCTAPDAATFSPLVCLIGMLLQSALYLLLAWYLSIVRPGKYGVAAKWNFCLKRSYWRPTVDVTRHESEESLSVHKQPQYFEAPPAAPVGVKVVDVSKVYGRNRVLSHVTLDIYKGEITVLLGHNGAGKTTLMSIISGMISPTEGKVYIDGQNIEKNLQSVRKNLGLCPQDNLAVPRLTVLENVMFFAMLKGESWDTVEQTNMKLLDRLGLKDKAHNKSDELSGGMKRRLQLACALCGGSSVLMLDEPTSGLDVETRRELWDLLLSLRGTRTVLLTTHFMEEADALGDRIAALHTGQVTCHATPMHLKKSMGSGFRLSLTTIGLPKEEQITSAITSVVPGATLKEKSYNTLTYNLPQTDMDKFPAMFSKLEDNKPALGIDSIGVGVSTLEEVFMRCCSNTATEFTADNVDSNAPERTFQKESGIGLYLRQMKLLIIRQMKYLAYNKTSFLVLQVFLPLLCLILFTYPFEDSHPPKPDKEAAMDLDIYSKLDSKRVIFEFNHKSEEHNTALAALARRHNQFDFRAANDIPQTVLIAAKQDRSEYNKYLLGIEINETSAKVLYTTSVRHAAPVALNMLSNILAADLLPWADDRTITTYNQPIKNVPLNGTTPGYKHPKDVGDLVTWCVLVLFVFLGVLTNAVNLPIKERILGTRHIHMMSGCPPVVAWLAALVAHTVVYTLVLIVPTVLITYLDNTGTLVQPAYHTALFAILLMGTMSYLAFEYFVSFFVAQRASGIVLSVIILVLGIVPAMVSMGSTMFSASIGWYEALVTLLLHVSPPATFSIGFLEAASRAADNAKCNLNVHLCPGLAAAGFEKCCKDGRGTECYFCVEQGSPGKAMLVMLLQTIIYMILVIAAQYGLFKWLTERVTRWRYEPPPHRFRDELVRAERLYVDKAVALPKRQISDAMLVHDLHKRYLRAMRPLSPVHAVRGISFSVKRGECFGLLGVNGAGKSTTFKMIAAEEAPTRGRIFANGHSLRWPRAQYLKTLAYCPQFFGLDEFLSGAENLRLILTMRGYSEADVMAETDAWVQVAGLEKYRDLPVRAYSGGCARRMATVAALASGAPVTLLDEPTAGVDVTARRRTHLAIRKGLRNDRSIIITSHSMDEMEALCSRIAILSAGELGAVGPAAALKAAHAAGHAARIKLRPPALETDGSASTIDAIKQAMNKKFNCTLKDEHSTMLHYHINETMRYSELFTALEQLKAQFPNSIEDYSVNETTLEEVFLSFAKPPPPPHHV